MQGCGHQCQTPCACLLTAHYIVLPQRLLRSAASSSVAPIRLKALTAEHHDAGL